VTTRTRAGADWLRRNRVRTALLAVLVAFFIAALGGIRREDLLITIMQGFSVGAITFLVASGLSLIFGLMDVLNLAHGELFMLGAYVGWTVYTRFDTFIDVLVPLLVLAAPFVLLPLWRIVSARVPRRRLFGGVALVAGLVTAGVTVTKFPLAIWDAKVFAKTPVALSTQVDLGLLRPFPADTFGWPSPVAFVAIAVAGCLLACAVALLSGRQGPPTRPSALRYGTVLVLVGVAVLLSLLKAPINEWVFDLSTSWRFLMAVVVAVAFGALLGAGIEVVLIRPLYGRPIHQLMLTLGLGFIIVELVGDVWGKPQFTMARPALFNGTGQGCPGQGLGGFFSGCSTVEVFGGTLRVYNEGFIVLIGLLVVIGVSLLLKRTRIGMIIRAGVQDPSMVQALGVNVRRVFTLVFALGAGLAALGGVLAAPSIGLETGMGAVFLLAAIVALAVGGLTSFAGAAVGALLVGLLQQIIIRFGQSGIDLPFLSQPFKPTPTLVPAAAILLMVVVLLVLPNGLFGRSEQ
jgi:branched-chain amino acid transport system permease protein